MNARYSWGIFYLVYWVYRSAYSIIGEVVIARLTSLGDASRYQKSTFSILNSDVTSVGFEFADEAPELYMNPDDDTMNIWFETGLSGKTTTFVHKYRKPD